MIKTEGKNENSFEFSNGFARLLRRAYVTNASHHAK
jgi:hypothetical protein